ncbi:36593_t:CDS:2, partial [Gigaspora margarita]
WKIENEVERELLYKNKQIQQKEYREKENDKANNKTTNREQRVTKQHSKFPYYQLNKKGKKVSVDKKQVTEANIEEMAEWTRSNYKAPVAKIILKNMIGMNKATNLKKKEYTRTLYKYNKMTKKRWESYQCDFAEYLGNNRLLQSNANSISIKTFNKTWDAISKEIKYEEHPKEKGCQYKKSACKQESTTRITQGYN